MKEVASLACAVFSAVAGCIAAAAIASSVLASAATGSPPGPFAAELWTASPVRVERSSQQFERLAPALSSYATEEAQHRP
jgi:hypothetical protein